MATENVIHRPTFKKMFKAAFKNFFSNLKLFIPLLLLVGAVMFGLDFVFNLVTEKALDGGGIGIWLLVFVLFVVTMLVGVMYTLSFVKAAMSINGDIGVMDCVSYAWSKLKTGLALLSRVFWFIGKWVLFIMIPLIIFAAVTAYMSGSRVQSPDDDFSIDFMDDFGASVFRATEPDLEDLNFLIEDSLESNYVDGFALMDDEPSMISQAVAGQMGLRALMSNTVNFILGLMGIAFMFIGGFFIIRNSVFSMFSFYSLIDTDGTSKEALKGSIQLSIGNFWRMAGTMFGLNFLLGLVFVVPIQLLKLAIGGDIFLVSFGFEILAFFVALMMGAVSIMFVSNFYGILKKEEEMYEMYGGEA